MEEYQRKQSRTHLCKEATYTVLRNRAYTEQLSDVCYRTSTTARVAWTKPGPASLSASDADTMARSKSKVVAENACLRKPLIVHRRGVKGFVVHIRQYRWGDSHALSAGLCQCPSRARNSPFLSIACCCFSDASSPARLAWVAVQRLLVQQDLVLKVEQQNRCHPIPFGMNDPSYQKSPVHRRVV